MEARHLRYALAQFAQVHADVGPPDREPAVAARLRELFGTGATALGRATTARDVHTIVGLAACGVGVGLGPTRMRLLARADVRFREVTPRLRLPDLRLSFRAADRSPVLAAFLGTVRAHCPEAAARLGEVLARRAAPKMTAPRGNDNGEVP